MVGRWASGLTCLYSLCDPGWGWGRRSLGRAFRDALQTHQ